MKKNGEDHCETCRYYRQDPDYVSIEEEPEPEDLTGICRRYPPVIIAGFTATSVHPDVSGATGWCGEYTPQA